MLIIGLGNIGLKYKNTYHNVGFMVMDKLVKKLNTKFNKSECKSKTAVVYKGGKKIIIAKPTTYMNLSGQAVRELIGKHHKSVNEIVIVYDDVDISAGLLRLRFEGSGGTHNGMKNIIECLNTNSFKRIRVGIGVERGEVPLMNFVLSKISGENKQLIDDAIERSCDALIELIEGKTFEQVMQKYNKA